MKWKLPSNIYLENIEQGFYPHNICKIQDKLWKSFNGLFKIWLTAGYFFKENGITFACTGSYQKGKWLWIGSPIFYTVQTKIKARVFSEYIKILRINENMNHI